MGKIVSCTNRDNSFYISSSGLEVLVVAGAPIGTHFNQSISSARSLLGVTKKSEIEEEGREREG